MAITYTYNLQTADNPFIEEDYGLITDTYIDDSQDFGAYLEAGTPNQDSIKYYPTNDVNQYSDSHPSILDGSFDTTVSTMDEGFTEGEPYLDYGLITVFDDRYGFGGISVSEEAEAVTAKSYEPPIDLLLLFSADALKTLVKVWVGTGQVFEIYDKGETRLIRQIIASGQLRFEESTTGALESFTANPPEDKTTFSFTGSATEASVASELVSGLFDITGAGGTKVEFNYGYYGDDADPGTSGQITIVNGVHDGETPQTSYIPDYTGVGIGSVSGILDERITKSYNESSIGLGKDDWRLVTQSPVGFDWGQVAHTPDQRSEDWEYITTQEGFFFPYGKIVIGKDGGLGESGNTRLLYTYIITGAGTSGAITLSGTPLVHPDVDYTPHYGIDRNIGIGTTGIQLSGGCDDIIVRYGYNGTGDIRFTPYVTIGGDLDLSKEIKPPSFDQDPVPTWDTEFGAAATERVTWDPAEGTVLFNATGTANESIISQTPEDVALFRFIGSTIDPDGDPKFTSSEVSQGGTISLNGDLVERTTFDYFGVGITTISGIASTREVGVYGYYGDDRDPGTSGIITVSGSPLENPDTGVTYIPHYGIDKNIGVGTTGIQFPVGPYGFDIVGNPLGGRYYSPIYPGNAGKDGNPGIGTFRLNDDKELTICRALIPYFGSGGFIVTSSAFEAFGNQVDDDVTTTLYQISGVGSCREIQNYGYYGDDADPGTEGIITISGDDTRERIAYDYERAVGSGSFFYSGAASDVQVGYSYEGTGSMFMFDGLVESFGAVPGQNVVLFNATGDAVESYTRATFIGSGTITASGTADSSVSYRETGVARNITLSGESVDKWIPNYPAAGDILIGKKDITCDSVDRLCDFAEEGLISFSRNTAQSTNTALIQISDAAATAEEDLFAFNGSGSITLSGDTVTPLFSYDKEGTGLFQFVGIAQESLTRATYEASGTITALSGVAESVTWNPNEGTILYDLNGSAKTGVEWEYVHVGVGQVNLSGTAETKVERELQVKGQSVLFRLSGELLYPDVRFIPHYRGGGTISILGSSHNKLVKDYEGSGSLFGLASGLEAFSKAPYIGVGTIYLGKYDPNGELANSPGGLAGGGGAGGGGSAGGTEKRAFEPARVYVCII